MHILSIPKALANYQERYRANLVEGVYRHEVTSVVGHAAAMTMLLAFRGGDLPVWLRVAWPAALAAATTVRLLLLWQVRRRHPSQHGDRDVVYHAWGAACSGLAWSVGFHAAFPHLGHEGVAQVMMLFAGICAGGIITLSSRVETYILFSSLLLGPPIITLLRSGDPAYLSTGLLGCFFLVFCGLGVRNANRMAHGALLRQYQSEDLLSDLATAKAELEEAWSRSEQGNEAKRQFLANISHEVRTPLNGILGMTELVLEDEVCPDRREKLGTLKRCGRNLLQLVDDLLDLSRIEAGRMDVERVPYDLRELLQEVHDVHAAQLETRTALRMRLEWDETLPERLLGDPVRVRQIVHNLTGNAVKFTAFGEVRLSARRLQTHDGERLLLQVQDTGIGIPEDRQEAIFESFTQVDGTTTRNYGGTGLGLAICRHLAELMGGWVAVSSELGVGSAFTVELPLLDGSAVEPRPPVRLLLAGGFGDLADELAGYGWVVRSCAWDGELWQEMQALGEADAEVCALVGHAADLRADPDLATALGRNLCAGVVAAGSSAEGLPDGVLLWEPTTGSAGLRALLQPCAAPVPVPRALDVLLAEDDRTSARLVVHHLQQDGHRVRVAGDGSEALRLFQERRPDLVLMDCQMPELDGPGAVRAIRALPDGGDVPIIALTANDSADDRERFAAAGVDAHYAKPFDRQALQRALHHALRGPLAKRCTS